MSLRILKPFVLVIFFWSQICVAQQDGLDENSFNDQPVESSQPQDQSQETNDSTQNEENLDLNTGKADESADSVNPALDRSAIPEGNEQEVLSDEIKSLNPDSLTIGQEVFPIFIYEDRGRKDPFAPVFKSADKVLVEENVIEEKTEQQKVLEGLAKFEVASLTLTAILIGKNTRPKALIKDPTGTVYQIHENDVVGRNSGIVKKIRQGQIVIVESRDQKDGDRLYTTQVLSLGK